MSARLCGCSLDALGHVEPEPDWIGNWPIMHGESERPVPGTSHMICGFASLPNAYCLCGHPNYLTCPEAFGDGSILGYEVEAAPDQQ